VPEGGRGLHYPNSADIILIHDHRPVPDVFGPVVERLAEMGLRFEMAV
jgi:hypothetical protein